MISFSLVVLTYNQAEVVLDCLNSLLLQNEISNFVELIISDDASTDNTGEIIKKWINRYSANFKKVEFYQQVENLGISANHKFGLEKTNGELIKYIGGDDILLPGAIDKYIKFFSINPEADCVCGDLLVLNYLNGNLTYQGVRPLKIHFGLFKLPANRQFENLCLKNFISAPGLCFRRKIVQKPYFLRSSLKRFEDWPTWLDLTRNGYKFYRMPSLVAIWRRHEDAVSNNPFNKEDTSYYENELFTFLNYIDPFVSKGSLTQWNSYIRKKQLNCIIQGKFDFITRVKIFLLNLLRPNYYMTKLVTCKK